MRFFYRLANAVAARIAAVTGGRDELVRRNSAPMAMSAAMSGITSTGNYSGGDVGIVTILHERMHRIERLRDDSAYRTAFRRW